MCIFCASLLRSDDLSSLPMIAHQHNVKVSSDLQLRFSSMKPVGMSQSMIDYAQAVAVQRMRLWIPHWLTVITRSYESNLI
ncbi:hypothetical protein EYC84_004524 [Monilinia fructicola]|uniref:Uncharacterized protein n=1 Tax=Monilinia fructicola TaxID=38448 RepID=A0A5M9K5Q5_MONFR|nr:hypothetical protein EYC84_004524 [Monilinia fructicola]